MHDESSWLSTAEQAELLRAAREGNPAALERLLWSDYDRLYRRVDRRIPARLRGELSAEDVLQDAFVTVWLNLDRFEHRDAEGWSGWVSTIADNKLSDRLRAAGTQKHGGQLRQAAQDGSIGGLLDAVIAAGTTPSGSVARREAERLVLLALAGLKSEYREALQLRYLEQLPVAQIANRMNRSEGSVQMLCQRALAKLREHLGRSSQFLSR